MALITNLEEFDSKIDEDLVRFTGHYLQQLYPGYLWAVRCLASKPTLIGFTLVEVAQYGTENVMIVHPRDCPTQLEFEKLVKKLGGELLERAKLSREGSKNVAVTEMPEGFNPRFDRTKTETKIILPKDR